MHLLLDPFSVANARTYESFPHQAQQLIRNIRATRSAGRNTSFTTQKISGISEAHFSPSKSQALDLHNNSVECSVQGVCDHAGHSLQLSQLYADGTILEVHHGHNSVTFVPIPHTGTSDTRRYDIHSTIPNDLISESGSFSTSFLFMVIELTIFR